MNLKGLLAKYRYKYKTIFNFIFKEFLKGKEKEEVQKIDLLFYDLWNRFLSCDIKETKGQNGCLFINEISDDLEDPPTTVIDVAFYNYESESLEPVDFIPVEVMAELRIRPSIELSEVEIIGHVMYEVFLFGANDENYLKNEKLRKKAWKEIEKDLKDIYNLGDD
jgi:hypothetical protein